MCNTYNLLLKVLPSFLLQLFHLLREVESGYFGNKFFMSIRISKCIVLEDLVQVLLDMLFQSVVPSLAVAHGFEVIKVAVRLRVSLGFRVINLLVLEVGAQIVEVPEVLHELLVPVRVDEVGLVVVSLAIVPYTNLTLPTNREV